MGLEKKPAFMWAMLLQFGHNMWREVYDHVRLDENLWREVTERFAESGGNLLLIDLAEQVLYPSHPELAVKGTWSPDRMRKELDRLRGLGLEPIPKLNFSTCHDFWLKDYSRMVSTPEYYKVCADVIKDVW